MNLFSQSKLTLKLKKQNSNSALPPDPANKCQDLTTKDSVKSEYNNLPNNSLLSENDSFVELLHTVRPQDEKTTMSQSVFKTTPVQNVPDVINESKQCPVCLQMIDLKNFINHVKSCGTSYNLSSEVLIKAVDLQERQTAEREALGLPKLTNSRDVKIKKKSTKRTKLKESNTIDEEDVNTLHAVIDDSKVFNKHVTHHTILGNKTMPEYSSKWKSMIGSQFMSDITIFSKNEHAIPAHILVLHVQCPDILNDIIIEESGTHKSKKMVMWSEYTYEACMAFLELIYSGQEQLISPEYRKDYLNLVTRYNVQIVINDDGKHGWFSEEYDKASKRKSSELYSTDNKRYRAHSPDMFMMDNTSEEIGNMSSIFLGTTVNDEKSLSVLKTKQWLYNCNLSQRHNSSFTGNLDINVLPQTISPMKSPAHSFHSASTVHIQLTPTSTENDYNMNIESNDVQINSTLDIRSLSPKSLSVDESSMKADLKLNNIKNVPIDLEVPSDKISTLTNSRKEPELITITSDSDNESIDMILSRYNGTAHNRSINLSNENYCTPFQASIKRMKNVFPFNSDDKSNAISVIELNDSSLDSIHSVSTNILHQRNCNTKLSNSVVNKTTTSTPRTKTFINIDDEKTVISTVPKYAQIPSSSNTNFIDLINDSSSDSIFTIDKIKNDSLSQS